MRAQEIITRRAKMIGRMLALQGEFAHDQSLFRQVVNTRTLALADGVVKSSTFPAVGAFMIPAVVLSPSSLLAPSSAATRRAAPKALGFGPFKAESEMTNGRGAMIGLAVLLFAEKFNNGAALF